MADRLVMMAPEDERWLELLRTAPDATPFHHPAWARMLADCYRYDVWIGGVLDPTGALSAGLPLLDVAHRGGRRRWVSLPFSDACSPIASDPDALRSLVLALDEARHDAGLATIEVRASLPAPATVASSDAVIHRRTLPASVEELWATTHRSRRAGVRTARKQQVVVRPGEREADLTGCFYSLHVNTRRRHGVPVQPKRFFELLWTRLLARGLGAVLIAEVDGEPIAANVLLSWGGTLVEKYSASDARHWHRRANDLLLWKALAWGVEHGDRLADLGRTDVGNTGLQEFKERWGGVREPLVYSSIGATGSAGVTRFASLAGPVLRHGPGWLTRATGEALYRYAA
jgi:CelD/BcsL family acetyltransferase involved in cellulose biosynthesis